jgi:catechol 2,3-dioxygenase-like lactoylglutathione lyase family enzyme
VIESFGGVILWTDNLEAMVAFYRDSLGLPVHSIRPHFVAFEVGGIRISIGRHSEVHGPTLEPARVMVNFNVADIAAAYDRLRAAGVEFLRPPEHEHWGGLVATFRDPDGNLLQLLQQPPA